MNRAQGIAGLALLLVAGAAGIWWGRGEAVTPPSLGAPVSTSIGIAAEDPRITVHVAGLVGRPGLGAGVKGSGVADPVAASSGILPGAQSVSIHLAAQVIDGQQIVVPGLDRHSPFGCLTVSWAKKIHL